MTLIDEHEFGCLCRDCMGPGEDEEESMEEAIRAAVGFIPTDKLDAADELIGKLVVLLDGQGDRGFRTATENREAAPHGLRLVDKKPETRTGGSTVDEDGHRPAPLTCSACGHYFIAGQNRPCNATEGGICHTTSEQPTGETE